MDSANPTTSLGVLQLDADLAWVADYTDRWIETWARPNSDKPTYWHMVHDVLSCKLLLSSRIIDRLPQAGGTTPHQQGVLLETSLRIFNLALSIPGATHMTHRASIFAFAGAVILRFGDRRDLVLRLSLRMAGDPAAACVPTFVGNAGKQLLAMLWYVL